MESGQCENCGGPLDSEYATKYCSQDCFHEGHSFAGEDHPNYQGKLKTTNCELCGEEFQFYPSEKEGMFCSNCVKTERWRDPPIISGSDHPRWNGGKIQLDCSICGTSVERYPHNTSERVTVCSRTCQSKWLSEAYTGENHPNWKGGGNENYGTGWAETRRKALERDDYQCVICGTPKEALGRNPDVHHIIPVRTFIESEEHGKEDAHRLDNVVSLCIDCHRKADFGKIPKAKLLSLIDADSPA